MAIIRTLNVLLKASGDAFTSTFDYAKKTLTGFRGCIASLTPSIGGLQGAMAALGVGVSFEAIRRGTVDILQNAEATDLMSKRLGMSFNSLTTLQSLADVNGSSVEVMNTSLEKMTKTLGKAAFGEQASIDSLARINLSYKDLASLSPEQQFATIMQSVNALNNPMMQAVALQDIFGRGAAELGNLVGITAEQMSQFQRQLEKSGKLVSDDQLKALLEAENALDDLSIAWQGLATTIVSNVAPAISKALSGINSQISDEGSWLNKTARFLAQASDSLTGRQPLDYGPANAKMIGRPDDSWKNKLPGGPGSIDAVPKYRAPKSIGAGTQEDAIFSYMQSLGKAAQKPAQNQVTLIKKTNELLQQVVRAVQQRPVEYTV